MFSFLYFHSRRIFYQLIGLYLIARRAEKVECLICGWRGKKFIDFDCGFGRIYKNAECPVCLSHPRHRFLYWYLSRLYKDMKHMKILHVAPEKCLERIFRRNNFQYISVDIKKGKAMKQENLQKLSFMRNTFDIIICLCVLEHVQDDLRALQEMHRVSKKEGVSFIDIPVDYSLRKTIENFSHMDPFARTKSYWQHDHVRLYGRDAGRHIEQVGFNVKKIYARDLLTQPVLLRYGMPQEALYIAKKN